MRFSNEVQIGVNHFSLPTSLMIYFLVNIHSWVSYESKYDLTEHFYF